MSFFKKLLGLDTRSKPSDPVEQRQPREKVPQPEDPAQDPNLIRVFDSYGRELFIPKDEWRKNVLPDSIRSNWNRPEELYGVIFGALNDGFRTDVVEAARQLYRIDTVPVRGACVWGIVLMEEGRLDDAEKIFRSFITRHGEEGSILTNLAKIYAKRGDDVQSEQILWHALEVDPNQENGFSWYEAIHRERNGEEAGLDAMRRVADLPGSWRAQLWLARTALKSGDLECALSLYRESLSRAPIPASGDFLMQISGDLGNAGHLPEILQLVEPHFDIPVHGLQVGNNLIKAHLDLGQSDAARRIVNQLYALNRPDWKEVLSNWDTEIAKVLVALAQPETQQSIKVAMLTIEGPVWLKPASPAEELFPARISDGPAICFLGSTAEIATNSKRIHQQLSDTPGRISRAIPLFLAETVEFGSNARVQTLVPWIVGETPGFVLSGVPWTDEKAACYARQGETPSDYAVITHLKPIAEPWAVGLRLIRTIDAKCLGTLEVFFPMVKPEQGLPGLARQLLDLLAEQADVESEPSPPAYQIPGAPDFAYYLLRLEQLLAVRCGSMDGTKESFLSGERDILDGNLQLCLNHPQNTTVRVLLAQTLLAMKRVRPDILPEFTERLVMLQKEQSLPEPAHAVIQRLIDEVLAT
jgi:tetratricopeptide (TPR) repeat protein